MCKKNESKEVNRVAWGVLGFGLFATSLLLICIMVAAMLTAPFHLMKMVVGVFFAAFGLFFAIFGAFIVVDSITGFPGGPAQPESAQKSKHKRSEVQSH